MPTLKPSSECLLDRSVTTPLDFDSISDTKMGLNVIFLPKPSLKRAEYNHHIGLQIEADALCSVGGKSMDTSHPNYLINSALEDFLNQFLNSEFGLNSEQWIDIRHTFPFEKLKIVSWKWTYWRHKDLKSYTRVKGLAVTLNWKCRNGLFWRSRSSSICFLYRSILQIPSHIPRKCPRGSEACCLSPSKGSTSSQPC